MDTSNVRVLESSDPDSFENYQYDKILSMASGKVQEFLNGEDNTLALKIYNYYNETGISGLFDDNYTEVELEFDEPIDFEGAPSKTFYSINESAIATTKYVIDNSPGDDGSYDYTDEVRLVRRKTPLKFHVNEPDKTGEDLFRVYNASSTSETVEDGYHDLVNYKVPEFYSIPKFAKDDYVFAGWYYNSSDGTSDGNTAFKFDSEIPANVTDVYAHWIPVGEVDKDADDDKELPSSMNEKYKGFELCGVQIRPKKNYDYNYEKEKEGGLRFVASISESLLSKINAVHTDNKIEYGFVSAEEQIVKDVVKQSYMNIDKDSYTLQYKGKNVNGVDTLLDNATKDARKCPNNFRYITNVDCTSKVGGYGSNPNIKLDHRNFTNYRLASYVVTYKDDESGANKIKNVAARAYLRYTDANGLLRTFYNDYDGTNFYGGCSTSYSAVENMATNTKTVKN